MFPERAPNWCVVPSVQKRELRCFRCWIYKMQNIYLMCILLHNSTVETCSSRKFPKPSVHNGCFVHRVSGVSVQLLCMLCACWMLFCDLFLSCYILWLIKEFDYCQAAASNPTNPASLTHTRSFLPVFWWFGCRRRVDAWFDNILKQQHVFFMQHGTDSDALPADICSSTVVY